MFAEPSSGRPATPAAVITTAAKLLATQGWAPATTAGRPSRLDEHVDHGHFILRDAGSTDPAVELTCTTRDYFLDLRHMSECLEDGGLALVDLAMTDTVGVRQATAEEITARARTKTIAAARLLESLIPPAPAAPRTDVLF